MVDEIKKEVVKEEVKAVGKSVIEEVRKDIVLMAKIDKDGMLVEEIPHNQQLAAYMLLHLTSRLQSRHMMVLNTVKKMEDERKKPNIITSIKHSPIMKGLFK